MVDISVVIFATIEIANRRDIHILSYEADCEKLRTPMRWLEIKKPAEFRRLINSDGNLCPALVLAKISDDGDSDVLPLISLNTPVNV